MDSMMDSYPPPYRLDCDLALFPVFIDTNAARNWAGARLPTFLGQSLLFLVAARYHRAEYGPDRMVLQPPQEDSPLYTEVSCALPTRVSLRPRLLFPQLWVDSLSPLPIGVGLEYGFAKAAANVQISMKEKVVSIDVSDDRGEVLRIRAVASLRFPSRLFCGTFRAIFPKTGLSADLTLKDAGTVSLLSVVGWRLDRLERWGVAGNAPFGFWLQQATIELGAPLQSGHPAVRETSQGL